MTTTDEFAHYPAYPANPPRPPRHTKPPRLVVAAIAAVGGLLLGGLLGSLNRPEPVTIEKPVEKIVTKDVTPAACLTALDLNEQAFGYASDSLAAILRSDYTTANTATTKMQALTTRVNAAKAECRATK